MSKESLIFIRGKWEIARIEDIGNGTIKREAWHRRDCSWICNVGQEEAILPMPPKPEKEKAE